LTALRQVGDHDIVIQTIATQLQCRLQWWWPPT